jgi:hypothetical protein
MKLEFLKGKVRDVAERSKQRGNMLAQLALAARRVAEAKQQLEVAEGEMQDALAAAEEYLQVRGICGLLRCQLMRKGDLRQLQRMQHALLCSTKRVLWQLMCWLPAWLRLLSCALAPAIL